MTMMMVRMEVVGWPELPADVTGPDAELRQLHYPHPGQHNHFLHLLIGNLTEENKPIQDGGEAKAPLCLYWLSGTD